MVSIMLDFFIILFLTLTVLLLIVAIFNEYYQFRTKVSCMPTVPKVRKELLKIVSKYLDDNHKNIAELGCGWGGLAVSLAKDNKKLNVTGIELSIFPYLISRFRKSPKNLKILYQNIYDFNLQNTDIVICYLSNDHMAKLEYKMENELKSGSIVISSTFIFSKKQPIEVVELLGIYNTKIYIYLF